MQPNKSQATPDTALYLFMDHLRKKEMTSRFLSHSGDWLWRA